MGKPSRLQGFEYSFLALVLVGWLCGCAELLPEVGMRRRVLLYDKDLSATYDRTKIKKSLTLDVLPRISKAKNEVLSHSENVVASLGQSKNGFKTWFTMIAFHEYELSVLRKYFFVVDERVGSRRKKGLRFDCEVLLTEDDRQKIRSAAGPKQVALLRVILENLRRDAAELKGGADAPAQDNQALDVSVLLIRQVFETILLELERSGVLVARLSDPNGVDFDHMNFGEGKIRLTAKPGRIIVVRIRLGALLCTFDELDDVMTTGQPAKLEE